MAAETGSTTQTFIIREPEEDKNKSFSRVWLEVVQQWIVLSPHSDMIVGSTPNTSGLLCVCVIVFPPDTPTIQKQTGTINDDSKFHSERM